MEKKRLVPKRRFLGDVGKWHDKRLGDVTEVIGTGKSSFISSKKKSKESPYAVLGSTSVIGFDSDYDYSGNFILTARVGANAGNIYKYSGKVKISDNTVFIKSENLDFIYILLKKYDLKKLSFGTGQPLIKASELKKLILILPSKKEQQKIGRFFKDLDEMITTEQRKVAKIKALKAAYLDEMFPGEGELVPKRRFAGFTEKWKEIELGDIGYTFSGLSGKTKKDFGHGTAEFVTYLNVFNNAISDIHLTEKVVMDSNQMELRYGDMLFTTSSETPHEVGMSSVWLDSRPNVYLNSFCFGFRATAQLNHLFFAYLLRQANVRSQMELLAQGISRYNISKGKVMEIKLLLPSDEEQQKIGEFFKQLDDKITNAERKLEKLKSMKQAYLQEMFV